MKHYNKAAQEQTFADDMKYELPQVGFKFVYIQAISPDYAEELVDQLNQEREE